MDLGKSSRSIDINHELFLWHFFWINIIATFLISESTGLNFKSNKITNVVSKILLAEASKILLGRP